jgi:hypothetical protein
MKQLKQLASNFVIVLIEVRQAHFNRHLNRLLGS